MNNNELLEYYMEQTNSRLDRIEDKLEQLLALRAQVFLLASVIATVVAGGIHIVLK